MRVYSNAKAGGLEIGTNISLERLSSLTPRPGKAALVIFSWSKIISKDIGSVYLNYSLRDQLSLLSPRLISGRLLWKQNFNNIGKVPCLAGMYFENHPLCDKSFLFLKLYYANLAVCRSRVFSSWTSQLFHRILSGAKDRESSIHKKKRKKNGEMRTQGGYKIMASHVLAVIIYLHCSAFRGRG